MPEPSLMRDPILVGVKLHDDEAALQLGRQMAAVTGGQLVLVHAYEPTAEWERDRALAALEQLSADLPAPVSVQARPNPSPVRALHEAAEELGASLLVAGGSRRAVPGGIAERLLHAAPCAVAIAPRDRRIESLRRIGVAFVDGPEGADALAIAAGLARTAGGRVRSFTVLESHERARAEAIVAKVRAAVSADLLEATDVLDGRVTDELTRVARDLDLLICGSRGYGPVRSLLLGGVTWTLAQTVPCPLLVVPRAPVPGFRTLTG